MSFHSGVTELNFANAGREYCLISAKGFHTRPQSTAAMQQIRPTSTYGLIYFRQLIQTVSVHDLKKLLAPDDHHVSLSNDEPVRMRIAALVMDGTLSLFESTNHISVPRANVQSAVKKDTVVHENVDPRQMQSPADLIIHQARSAEPVATPPDQMLDESAQVAVLIAAAEQGTPLCELCKS